MNIFEAIFLGLIQGLTEFLPVSSSGHLEIGQALLGTSYQNNLLFTVVVHGATMLSTVVVFYSEIKTLTIEGVNFKMNDSKKYLFLIFISMLPVLVVGLFFEDKIESFFGGDIHFVGAMLLVTAGLLSLTYFAKKEGVKEIRFLDAFLMGLAQALAVLPGISRAGATISTGVILGNKREDVARFSFLMVLIPIIGANILSLRDMGGMESSSEGIWVLVAGFISAFFSGLFACKWMIKLVKKGKLIYFAVYCVIIGSIALFLL
ncbi:MAG: undecaprenyl-diphosphate phosphatase [Bacteroidales bacterium]|nr:undecaprenyl-diphosphate phosphatase [Bacteroidales bacterium]MCF8391316.1 undecaprenyl-diphosphate phosphatase [Bacteroidales bacterium]